MAAKYKSALGLENSTTNPWEKSLPKCVCRFPTLTLITPERLNMAVVPSHSKYATPTHLMIEKTKFEAMISAAIPVADKTK